MQYIFDFITLLLAHDVYLMLLMYKLNVFNSWLIVDIINYSCFLPLMFFITPDAFRFIWSSLAKYNAQSSIFHTGCMLRGASELQTLSGVFCSVSGIVR